MKNKDSWDVKELLKAKEILDTSSFDGAGYFIEANTSGYLEGIIKNNFAQASSVFKGLAKSIANVLKEKDPEQ